METKSHFSFEISLSVLNHLGRNLYRSFATVLGEAISNAWDAEAKSVWIYIDKENNSFFIKDDGTGMSADDFQGKFLKIGYSRRKGGQVKSPSGRPYIGRKGIGKLALLSCAEKIHVISKIEGGEYVGGIIDNSGLDNAIKEDLTPGQCPLDECKYSIFEPYTKDHEKGTIIYFEGIKDGIRNSLQFLRKIIALYFRFSLLDPAFTIYMDDEAITHESLNDLAKQTEFLWIINKLDDPYVQGLRRRFTDDRNEQVQLVAKGNVRGFIASVEKPRDLKIITTDERVGVDLFVNGRLRERDVLKHIPTARVAENYLYGQIHFDELDDGTGEDRFTSSRESIVAEDPKYKELLDILKNDIINKVIEQWDNWRRKHRKTGDPDNPSITPKARKAEELYNAVSEEYALPSDSTHKKRVDSWVKALSSDASFNFASYAECFISENLIRIFIQENKIPLSEEAKAQIQEYRRREDENKKIGNISIDIRQTNSSLSYLEMNELAALVDKKDANKEACLLRDAKEYKPIRNALAHTARLTDVAKQKLTSVYENIKGRIRTLLDSTDSAA